MGIRIGIGNSPIIGSDSRGWTAQKLISMLQEDIAIWNNFDGIWLLSQKGASFEVACEELKGSGRNATLTGSGAVYFDNELGMYSDGRAALNLNHKPDSNKTSFALNAGSIGFFLVDNFGNTSSVGGCSDGTNNLTATAMVAGTGRTNYYLNHSALAYQTLTEPKGLFIYNRDGDDVEVFQDGVSKGKKTNNPTSIPDKNLYALTFNDNDGAFSNPTINRVGLYFIGGKWTIAQIGKLNTIFYNYFNAIGATSPTMQREHALVSYKREPYVTIYQCKNMVLARSLGKVLFSTDKGVTWATSNFVDAGKISDGYIWDNGNINFAIGNKVYFSNNGLTSVSELVVKDTDGVTNYVPHNPSNATRPGYYFRVINYGRKQYFGETEIRIFGNYGNTINGANPTNIYRYSNNGANIQVIYKFGQNPYYRDNGTASGGATGTLLGDAGNALWVRHVHSLVQKPNSNTFYLCTGDFIRAERSEVVWMKGEYDGDTDTIAWSVIYTQAVANRMKACGMQYYNGYIYYMSDDGVAADFGMFKVLEADVADVAEHIKLTSLTTDGVDMIVEDDGTIIATKRVVGTEHYPIIISKDQVTFTHIDLDKIPGFCNWLVPIIPKNSDGYYALMPPAVNGSEGDSYFWPAIHVKIK